MLSKLPRFDNYRYLRDFIYDGLLEETRHLDRGSAGLEELALEARELAGEGQLDWPFADSFRQIVREHIDEADFLYSALVVAVPFVEMAGRRQFGGETFRLVEELLSSQEGFLERYRMEDSLGSAIVRGEALQLAQAVGLPLERESLMSEKALRRNCRALWLDILRTELPANIVAQEYRRAMDEGAITVDDFVDQLPAMLDHPGFEQVSELYRHYHNLLRYQNHNEADRLALLVREPNRNRTLGVPTL